MTKERRGSVTVWLAVLWFVIGSLGAERVAYADTAAEINASVDAALVRFRTQVSGAEDFLKAARGVLVFPEVVKIGFIFGAEYGEGALRIDGRSVAYYNLAGGSFGLQAGAQKMGIILLFMQQKALENFRASSGWRAGVDGSVALVSVGAGGSIDTTKFHKPILGFVVGQKGLMVDISLAGSKITRLKR